MKIRYNCVCLELVALCTLLAPLPARADEGVFEWAQVDQPGLRGKIIVTPSEVSEIAVGRRGTIYASDNVDSVIYKSINGGSTWEDISSRLVSAGAVLPANKIAIAPDTTNVVAVVADSGTGVYLSIDGGSTWNDTDVPGLAGTIQAIAISRQYIEADLTLREIAIGTAAWGNATTTGQVWVRQVGKYVPSWQQQGLTIDPAHTGGEVSAIAYSPGYQRDDTIVVVASTANDFAGYQNKTWLCIGKRSTEAGTTAWNTFSGYPVEIATAASPSGGDAAGVLITAALALPSDFDGSDEDLRQLLVSYDREPDASDDIYRIENTSVYRLNVNSGAAIDLTTISYFGTMSSGKLLAGDKNPVSGTAAVRVRRTTNPWSTSPTWLLASAPPSGPGNASVSWSPEGDLAYCGTGQSPGVARDESAFSMSSDGGDNWQQLSLMDTTIQFSDLAPAPGSDTLFVATYSSFGPEGVWRSARTQGGIGEYWSRQTTMNTASDRAILRLSPDYATDYTIYAAEAGGTLMAVSHNRGNTWKKRQAMDNVVDIVVEGENTVYAASSGGYIRKSLNGAFTWEDAIPTGLSAINMLTISGKTIFVGGRNGEVAYSTDGGASFSIITRSISAGDVQIVTDAGYAENHIIYAATDAPDKGIWRWTVGLSTAWEQIDESITALGTGQRIGGLATSPRGTLYALRLEPASGNSGGMTRSLNPAEQNSRRVEFDFANEALPAGATFDSGAVFPNTLPYLKLSAAAGQNDLWAVDTANEVIYRFQDTLGTTEAAPAIFVLGPASEYSNPVNPVTGKANEIAFTWSRPSSATTYSLEIAYDSNFTEMVATVTVNSSLPVVSVAVGPDRTGDKQLNWLPGHTYYWRVRATAPLFSAYSAARSIIVETIMAQAPSLLSPANGSTGMSRTPPFSWSPLAGISQYRFVLADSVSLAIPIIDARTGSSGYALDRELEPGSTYYWAVKAVAPAEGGWSSIANFTVREKPVEPPPPVTVMEVPPPVITLPAPQSPPEIVILPPPAPPAPVVPAFLWVAIAISLLLVTAVTVLIIRTGK